MCFTRTWRSRFSSTAASTYPAARTIQIAAGSSSTPNTMMVRSSVPRHRSEDGIGANPPSGPLSAAPTRKTTTAPA